MRNDAGFFVPAPASNEGPPHAASGSVDVNVPGLGIARGRQHGVTDAWFGLPYALPPLGNFRWQPARPVTSWAGEPNSVLVSTESQSFKRDLSGSGGPPLDAVTPGPACISSVDHASWTSDGEQEAEDCLYLNVWTPRGHIAAVQQRESKPLPVVRRTPRS
ncbi:hypothetical protein EON66_03095 [archaeon]|nr:MAG: hypothetical protein EON66_03095 [archaeon]